MFCPKCDKENPDSAKFCSNCGASIEIVMTAKHRNPVASGVADPMTFGKSLSTCLSKFFDFNGRASRSELWWFYLFYVILSLGAMLVDSTHVVYWLVYLVFFFPSLAVGARRLHDTNRSGWWLLIVLTIIGMIPLYIWFASKGSAQENRYGSPPLSIVSCRGRGKEIHEKAPTCAQGGFVHNNQSVAQIKDSLWMSLTGFVLALVCFLNWINLPYWTKDMTVGLWMFSVAGLAFSIASVWQKRGGKILSFLSIAVVVITMIILAGR